MFYSERLLGAGAYRPNQVICEYGSPVNTTITLLADGIYELMAISGGGRGHRTDGGVDPYGDTGWATHYYFTGGTGAYYLGNLRLYRGNISVVIGSQTSYRGGRGGDILLGSGFYMVGGVNAEVAGDTWYVTRAGGYLTNTSSVISTITYNAGYNGADRGAGHDGYDWTTARLNAPVPGGYEGYGFGGGTTSGTGYDGGNGYIRLIYKGAY